MAGVARKSEFGDVAMGDEWSMALDALMTGMSIENVVDWEAVMYPAQLTGMKGF